MCNTCICWQKYHLKWISSRFLCIYLGPKSYSSLRWFHCENIVARQNRRFADDIFKCILLNENLLISIRISLKFIPNGTVNIIPALVQIMAWRWLGGKPLSEPMMISLPTHIYASLCSMNKPVSPMRASPGGLSWTRGKLWQDYSSCYMFLNIKRNIF